MAKTQFPKRKIGMLLIWACLFLPLVTLSGINHTSSARNDHALIREADPELVGPETLCIVFGGVVGTFSGGGNPNTDVYSWIVTSPTGQEIFNRTGGAQFETIKLSFNEIGDYRISLNVRRNNDIILTESRTVKVQKGPELAILPDYLLCGDSPTEITALNPNTPNLGQYTFTWTDVEDNPIGSSNSIFVTQEGFYKFEIFLNGTSGVQECLITGSTYVGPSLDFELQVSSAQVCEGQTLRAKTDTPISGEWFIIRPNSNQKTSLGTAYEINLEPEGIPDVGIYTLIYSATDPNFPDCKSERKISFEVVELPKVNVSIIENPDNCAAPNGVFQIVALTQLDSLKVIEMDVTRNGLFPNQSLTLTDLEPQIYTISAYANGCEFNTLFNLESKNPPIINPSTPDIILPELTITPETCGDSGVIPGSLQVIFNQGEVDGEFRILAPGIGQIDKGEYLSEDTLLFSLPGGNYLLELKVDGCTYPVEEISIPKKPQVSFSNPREIQICESFEFKPETSEDLLFTLVSPDQSSQTISSGESFTLTQSGEYELIGKSKDPNSGLCPKTEKFSTTISENFTYELTIFEEDCFGNQVFKVKMDGLNPEEAAIRWLNAQGEIVGRNELFFAIGAGDYSLVVQPLQSGFCPEDPIKFTIEPPVFQVDVLLEANKICPEPGTSTIQLSTNESVVKAISWLFFDDQGNRRDLPEFENLQEITVDVPGSYEAVVFNRIGCEIGRNFITVENSTLLTPPVVEESYGVCSKGKKGPVIDPGAFAEYFWYYDEQLVSTNPQFSPTEVGNYNLMVVSEDGCEFFITFSTYDACSFDYVFPSGMVLDDPSRNFEVRVSKGITEAELFIINRQGALIHHEKSTEIPFGEAFLKWDGRVSGVNIPLGTYVVILIGKNPLYQYEEKIIGSLLVID